MAAGQSSAYHHFHQAAFSYLLAKNRAPFDNHVDELCFEGGRDAEAMRKKTVGVVVVVESGGEER